jgi:hypothetical protein
MRKQSVLLLIIAVALSFSAPVEAVKWVNVADHIYVDSDSVSKSFWGHKEAWIKVELPSPSCANDPQRCTVSMSAYERYYKNKEKCLLQLVVSYTDGSNEVFDYSCSPEKLDSNTWQLVVWQYLHQ